MGIRAIIIDDEPIADRNIASILRDEDQLDILAEFQSPYEGLLEVLDSYPDVVFMNIEMKELNGIKLANIIKRKNPEINIVFVTDSERYAINAFEVGVLDYVLLPIEENRLDKTIGRLRKKLVVPKEESPKIVGSFGGIYFLDQEHNVLPEIKWRTKKTEELFSFLLHNHDKDMKTSVIIDLLWPHVNSNQGTSLLYSAVYEIRKMMKQIDFDIEVENNGNAYCLKLHGVRHDIWEWELAMDELPPLTLDTVYDHLQVVNMYKGGYLARNDYFWAVEERSFLNDIWWHHIEQVVKLLRNNNKYMEAIRMLTHAKDICMDSEKAYFNLMKVYAEMKDSDRVMSLYNKLKSTLFNDVGASPSVEIEEWYKLWATEKV